MSLSVTYATVNGRLVEEDRGGVITRYVSDTLGSVIQTRDASGNQTSSTTFWPFREVRTSSGTGPSPWGFCGIWGYFKDPLARLYVRASVLRDDLSRWMTVDPLWPDEQAYSYVDDVPILGRDPTGASCKNTAMKGILDCTFRKGSITKGSKTRSNSENRECDTGKSPGPLKCYVHTHLSTIQKGYGRADIKVVGFSVEGDCGLLGNILLNQSTGIFGGVYVGILKSLFGDQGVKKPGWYRDCKGTADFWMAVFECGPEYCPKTNPTTPTPSCSKPQSPITGPAMPGMPARGGSNPIW